MRGLPAALDERQLLCSLGQAVIVTDPEGVILFWNTAAEKLYGWSADDVLGRPVVEITPSDQTVAEATTILAALREGERWSGEMVLRRADGTTFVAQVTDTPVLDDSGVLVGIVGISEDVTEVRRAEFELQRSEQRLRTALDAGRFGVWEWDPSTDRLTWDDRMHALVGMEPGTFAGTAESYLAMVHPDDRAVVSDLLSGQPVAAGSDIEHRVLLPDGSVRWLLGRANPVIGDDGEVAGLLGVASDITARREAEVERATLLESEARARRQAEALQARTALLARVTAQLTVSLDLDERLDILARLTVPYLADACAIYLLGDGHPEPVLRQLHHVDPDMAAELERLIRASPARPDAAGGAGAAIRDGATSAVLDITDDQLRAAVGDDDEKLDHLRRLRLRSAVSMPLTGRSGPLGAVTFLATGERTFTHDDVSLAEAVCRRAGIAVENAQLLLAQEEIETQLRFQAALLEAQNEAGLDGILVVGSDASVVSHNQRFLQVWGFDPQMVEGWSDDDLLREAAGTVVDPDHFHAVVARAYADRRWVHDEISLLDGRILERHGAPLFGPDGEYLGWAWYFRDITTDRLNQAEVIAVGERFAALARTLQQSLLPPKLPDCPGIDLAARYHPALEGLEVGGDFYDVFAVDGAWMLVIGDVCGKGAHAASLTALARYTIRAASMHSDGPAAVLAELNATMLAHRPAGTEDQFATVCCVRLERAHGVMHATIACGGHPAPLLLRADGRTEEVEATGTLIGLFEDVELATSSVDLGPGDALVTMTDGVLEARNAGGTQVDETDLAAFLGGLTGRTAADISEAVEAMALTHQGGVAHDDIAVLVARVRPTDDTRST